VLRTGDGDHQLAVWSRPPEVWQSRTLCERRGLPAPGRPDALAIDLGSEPVRFEVASILFGEWSDETLASLSEALRAARDP
jgi:hypothetical protein